MRVDMSMEYYDVENAKFAILDILNYNAIQDKDVIIYKDTGRWTQILVTMQNSKVHNTSKVYLDDNGQIEIIIGHRDNFGFYGTKYFKIMLDG